MTVDEKREAAEKIRIIESDIIMSLEAFDGQLKVEQKNGLKQMTKAELQQLAVAMKRAGTRQEANTKIVHAICDSQEAGRAAEEIRLAGIGGPAKVDLMG